MPSSPVDKVAALAALKHPTTTTLSFHEGCSLLDRHPNAGYKQVQSGAWTAGIIRNGRHLRISAAWLRQQLHIEVVEPPPVLDISEPEPDMVTEPAPLRELAPEQIPKRAVMKPDKSRKRAVPAGAR